VGDVFLTHFRPLSANWALFKCHGLPEHFFLTMYIHIDPLLYPSVISSVMSELEMDSWEDS